MVKQIVIGFMQGKHRYSCFSVYSYFPLYSYLISDQIWSIKLLLVLCKETIGIHALRPVCSLSRATSVHAVQSSIKHLGNNEDQGDQNEQEKHLENFIMIWAANASVGKPSLNFCLQKN